MFHENIPNRILKDLLTQEEIEQCLKIEHGGSKALVAMCSKEDDTLFKGYYPLNAPIEDEDLAPHRVNNELDIMPVVGGG